MMWVLWYTAFCLCLISLPHGKLPFEEIVEGILCLCLLLIHFLSTQWPHFHLFRRPRLSKFLPLFIFLSQIVLHQSWGLAPFLGLRERFWPFLSHTTANEPLSFYLFSNLFPSILLSPFSFQSLPPNSSLSHFTNA